MTQSSLQRKKQAAVVGLLGLGLLATGWLLWNRADEPAPASAAPAVATDDTVDAPNESSPDGQSTGNDMASGAQPAGDEGQPVAAPADDPAPVTAAAAAPQSSPVNDTTTTPDDDATNQGAANAPAHSVRQETIPPLVGTRRMIAAHAPLRTPAVADPDSVENKRILQAMVFKALERSSSDSSPAKMASPAP